MLPQFSRRGAIKTLAATGLATAGGQWGWLGGLPVVRAEDAKLDSKCVQFDASIEPLVRLLEDTPRERLLEEVAGRIKKGTSYRDVLAALLLAGTRNIQPRPSVGFKFHAVLVVNSAHIASQASPDEHRWLPIFWALDQFKSSQAQDIREGNWTMPPADENAVPRASKAKAAFIEAMDNWDEPAADAAAAALARNFGAAEVFELLYRYGCRDFRSIGHKAIYVANSKRTLSCIGWQHAEPVVRSLAYALLNRESNSNPAKDDLPADRSGRHNAQIAKKLRDDWQDGKLDSGATTELLAVLREAKPTEASDKVVEIINRGISPQSIWDAILVGAGELLARQPGIVGLHAVTSANALHYGYQDAGDDNNRRLLMLQASSFLPHFLEAMRGRNRGSISDLKLDQLPPADDKPKDGSHIDHIFRQIGSDRQSAARHVLAYLAGGGSAEDLINAARVVIFHKGRDSHDYKFSSAALEDFYNVSRDWRNRYLASSVFNLKSSSDRDNQLVQRTRDALGRA
jgi:hypothetical protein